MIRGREQVGEDSEEIETWTGKKIRVTAVKNRDKTDRAEYDAYYQILEGPKNVQYPRAAGESVEACLESARRKINETEKGLQ
jgi:hypothetical protein